VSNVWTRRPGRSGANELLGPMRGGGGRKACWVRSRKMGTMVHPPIYSKLRDVAANEQVVFYHQIAPLAGLDMSLAEDRNRIADILDEISTFEHEQGRPLLSVVVVQAETGRPGKGFYKLATRLQLFSGKSDIDEMVFFIATVKQAYSTWKI
jgi:hypothetical protein